MRSAAEARLRLGGLAVLLIAVLSTGIAAAQQNAAPANTASPEDGEIARAIETLRADPNLATERTIKTLRWKDSTAPRSTRVPAWLRWIAGLFRWLEQSARVLVWCAGVALAGLLAGYIVRLSHGRAAPRLVKDFAAPTHVQDLDIRPETLPGNIGAAARLLWDGGEHRAALALLYRGLLSRLAHVHHVPIRDSSTEGDCLALAATHLTRGSREYASRLVSVWQRVVYGHQSAQTSIVHALCDDFASALDAASPEGAA